MKGSATGQTQENMRASGLNLGLLANPEYAAPLQLPESNFTPASSYYAPCEETPEVLECKPVHVVNDGVVSRRLTVLRHSSPDVIFDGMVSPGGKVVFDLRAATPGYLVGHCYEYYWNGDNSSTAGWALGNESACAGVTFGAGGGGGGGACTNITSCDISIDAAGTYCLNSSLTDFTLSPCITINASDVVLNCGGYTLTGVSYDPAFACSDPSGHPGVRVLNGTSNFTVRDCVITNFCYGLRIEGPNGTVTNNTVYDTYYGIGTFPTSTNVSYSYNNLSRAAPGLSFGFYIASDNNTFYNDAACNFTASGEGFYFAFNQTSLFNHTCTLGTCKQDGAWGLCIPDDTNPGNNCTNAC